jgi:hypothetical protein
MKTCQGTGLTPAVAGDGLADVPGDMKLQGDRPFSRPRCVPFGRRSPSWEGFGRVNGRDEQCDWPHDGRQRDLGSEGVPAPRDRDGPPAIDDLEGCLDGRDWRDVVDWMEGVDGGVKVQRWAG